jgi:hypothetical protein
MAQITDPPEVALQEQLAAIDAEIAYQDGQKDTLQAAMNAIPGILKDLRAARAKVAKALQTLEAPSASK